jgi:hypothetical protein
MGIMLLNFGLGSSIMKLIYFVANMISPVTNVVKTKPNVIMVHFSNS